jgi:hypothetical protein
MSDWIGRQHLVLLRRRAAARDGSRAGQARTPSPLADPPDQSDYHADPGRDSAAPCGDGSPAASAPHALVRYGQDRPRAHSAGGVSRRADRAHPGRRLWQVALAVVARRTATDVRRGGFLPTDWTAHAPPAPAARGASGRRRLDAGVQYVISAAAVIGTRFREEVLAQVAGVGEEKLVAALETAERSMLIRADGQEYTFTHDKVAEAVYGVLALARRRLFHRRALRALEGAATIPGVKMFAELARHALAAEEWEEAVHYHEQAGKAA